jgi:DNA recombination protein Rad52
MAFRGDQLAALRAKLSAKDVQTKVMNGFSLSYVEGWYTIAEANRIFGFDGWDRETLTAECVWQGVLQGVPAAAYVARVRVRVHAGDKEVTRDGSGFGTGTGATQGDAHEKAIKEAETDAMKRALATFGNRFGLALYDRAQSGVTKRRPQIATKATSNDSSLPPSGWVLRAADGKIVEIFQDPQAYYARARQLLGELRDPLAIRELWKNNEEALKALRIAHPELRDGSKAHYTILFARLCKEQARVAESAVASTKVGHQPRESNNKANTNSSQALLQTEAE